MASPWPATAGPSVAGARCPVVHGPAVPGSVPDMADAYAACDLVVMASTWEGFGNPSLESAVHRRALAIGPYPVAAELAAFGFRWFALEETAAIDAVLAQPDEDLMTHNQDVARRHFDVRDLPRRIESALRAARWPLP